MTKRVDIKSILADPTERAALTKVERPPGLKPSEPHVVSEPPTKNAEPLRRARSIGRSEKVGLGAGVVGRKFKHVEDASAYATIANLELGASWRCSIGPSGDDAYPYLVTLNFV